MEGETLYYTVHVGTTTSESFSKIAYVELVDRNSEVVQKVILALEDGSGTGHLQIPVQLASDHYLLRFYTRISPILGNRGVFSQFITVINAQKPPQYFPLAAEKMDYNFIKPVKVPLLLNEDTLNQSVEKEISLYSIDAIGDYSISISMDNPFLPIEYQGHIMGEIYEPLDKSTPFIAEPYGHILHGNTSGISVDTIEIIFLSAHGKQSNLFSAHPNVEGEVFFDLGAFKGYDYFIAQSSQFEKQLNFSLKEPFLPLKFKTGFVFPNLVLQEKDRPFISDLILSSKVAPYFYADTTTYFSPIVTGIIADHTYYLDDFTRFENVATTLKEYVSEVMVRGQSRKTLFKVINAPKNTVFDENPLILIDDMPVFDTDALGAFDPIKFKKLAVVTREFSFNKDKFSGAISFASFGNDFGGYELPANALYLNYPEIQRSKSLLSQHLNHRIGEANIPDFRNALFWNPAYKEDKLHFYTSKISGAYSVTISALDHNGKLVFYTDSFNVKESER
jgi:hypothetical protein